MRFLSLLVLLCLTLDASAGPLRNRRQSAPSTPSVALESGDAASDALSEVNQARAARGLAPFLRDEGLTIAAKRCAETRARWRIAGHLTGGMGDFAALPAGSSAAAGGCGALEPSWGWQTCCAWDGYSTAGAAVAIGHDGKRYMHLFVR